jgi:predicted PurR-regulated permease PerM
MALFLDDSERMKSTDRGVADNTIALWVIATIATVFFLRASAQLLIPIVLAVLISYVLEPLVAWLARHRIPRLVGTSLLMLAVLGSVAWGGYTLRDEVMQAVESLPQAAKRAREMVMSQSGSGPAAHLQRAAKELRGESAAPAGNTNQPQRPAATSGRQAAEAQSSDEQRGSESRAPAESQPSSPGEGQGLPGLVQRGVGSVFALAGHITVIFFLVFFLLLSGRHARARIIEVAGPDDGRRRTAATIIDDINSQIQRFLVVRLVTGVVVGALTWVVLAWIGVEHAAFWGMLAGLFNSIPYFGPIIVSGGLFIVGMVQGGGVSQALQMSGAALVITSLEGWLLTPPLMGKAERMSVLAVFLGLLLWTWIWGAWGTILGVPMLVMMKSIADHVPRLKPIGRLMAP